MPPLANIRQYKITYIAYIASVLNCIYLKIAGGMAFLSSNHVVHRDLAARNVLISSDFTMKISDFGLSKDQNYYTSQGGKLPWKWMALESIVDHRFSVYSDVWAFGITMWEIFTLGTIPYPTKSPEDVSSQNNSKY